MSWPIFGLNSGKKEIVALAMVANKEWTLPQAGNHVTVLLSKYKIRSEWVVSEETVSSPEPVTLLDPNKLPYMLDEEEFDDPVSGTIEHRVQTWMLTHVTMFPDGTCFWPNCDDYHGPQEIHLGDLTKYRRIGYLLQRYIKSTRPDREKK